MTKLPSLFLQNLEKYPTISLATADPSGAIDCASVFFAFDGDGTIYFATASATLKVDNLQRRPHVALATDDRNQSGIQIRGKARMLEGAAAADARRLLLERHPKIAHFLEKPAIVYYAVTPEERFLINFAWGVDWRLTVKE